MGRPALGCCSVFCVAGSCVWTTTTDRLTVIWWIKGVLLGTSTAFIKLSLMPVLSKWIYVDFCESFEINP